MNQAWENGKENLVSDPNSGRQFFFQKSGSVSH